jgi:hypothetical protein
VTIVVGARVGTGTLTNIVSVSSDVNDPNLGNNTETENTTVLIP